MPIKAFHPEMYQGNRHKRSYFEGWYYKLISQDRAAVISIIPGVSFGTDKSENHSFIQIIEAATGKTEYIKYPLEAFNSDKNRFFITIGNSFFSGGELSLDIRKDNTILKGELKFSDIIRYPNSMFSPNIMGPFSFIPFMECNHAVLNIKHSISGCLMYNGKIFDFTGGEGYIEKDWGRSFPKSWIWLQGSHFEKSQAVFMISLAHIPFLNREFTGLISFLKLNDVFINLSTYSGAKISYLNVNRNNTEIKISSHKYELIVNACFDNAGVLKAPVNGNMIRDIKESISAQLEILLTDKKGNMIFKDKSINCGMELADADKLQI